MNSLSAFVLVAAFAVGIDANCVMEPTVLPGGTVQCPTEMPYNMATRCCEVPVVSGPVNCFSQPITLPGGNKICSIGVYNSQHDCCVGELQPMSKPTGSAGRRRPKPSTRRPRNPKPTNRRVKREAVCAFKASVLVPGQKFCSNYHVYNEQLDCCTTEIRLSPAEKQRRRVAAAWGKKYEHLRKNNGN